MKYRIEIRDGQNEDILIYAKQPSPVLEKIESILCEADRAVFGYAEDKAVRLAPEEVYCFFTQESRVWGMTDKGKFYVKDRLYQLEERFSSEFVKINQSCMVNVSKIERFDASIGGALLVTLKNGYRDYISRRQLKSVKERIGL